MEEKRMRRKEKEGKARGGNGGRAGSGSAVTVQDTFTKATHPSLRTLNAVPEAVDTGESQTTGRCI